MSKFVISVYYRKTFPFKTHKLFIFLPNLGWISSVHWSFASICEVVQLHVVQLTSGQKEILQKAWEAYVVGGGKTLQRRTAKWETRSQTEMGLKIVGQAEKGHHARMSRGFCAEHNWQTTIDMRPLESRSKRQNEADWLSAASWQSEN